MNGFVLKMVEKNTKPPLWKRLYVPGGITFTSLSFILDEMFALPHEASFGFEFMGCRCQMREDREYSFKKRSFQFDRRNPDNTYIDDFLLTEPWFSFYRKTVDGERAFRVEIEERFSDAALPYPQVIKSVILKGDTTWDAKEINDYLKEKYRIAYKKEPAYLTHAEILDAVTEDSYHLSGCSKPVSALMEMKDMSIRTMMETIAKIAEIDIVPECLKKDDVEGPPEQDDTEGIPDARDLAASVSQKTPINDSGDSAGEEVIVHPEEADIDPQLEWVARCETAAGLLYGACPMETFYRMCRVSRVVAYLTDSQIEGLFSKLSADDRICVRHGKRIVREGLLKNGSFKNLLSWHVDGGDYYIPTEKEINELWGYGYPKSDPVYRKAFKVFKDKLYVKSNEIDLYLGAVFDFMSLAGDVGGTIESLKEEGFQVRDQKKKRILRDTLQNIFEQSRKAIHKGNRAIDKLSERDLERFMNKEVEMEIDPFPEPDFSDQEMEAMLNSIMTQGGRKGLFPSGTGSATGNAASGGNAPLAGNVPKIYPNDPCPCGSGKKYKKCCGRSR